MDSKIVNRSIRENIRPLLKQNGFTRFDSRNCWRHHEDRIDCIRFWTPFNWVEAEIKGITSFSFYIQLGIFLDYVPPTVTSHHIKQSSGKLLPKEYECDLRRNLFRNFSQPHIDDDRLWYVSPNGDNLSNLMHQIKTAILSSALPWFDRFSDKEEVLRTLLEEKGSADDGWGFGAFNSPKRSYMIGYVALSAHKWDIALDWLEKALNFQGFDETQLKVAVSRARQMRRQASG